MGAMQKERLRPLTIAEQRELRAIAKASSERVDRVQRATALLAVAGGADVLGGGAGGRLSEHRARSRIWCGGSIGPGWRRWRSRPGAVGGRPTTRRRGPGSWRRRSGHRIGRCDGTATWSLSTLERTVRREGLPRVGATTIRRVLHDAGSSYQRTRTWCPTGTAQRKRKAGVVQVVDPQTEEKRGPSTWRTGVAEAAGIPLWCQDEAGPYQAIPQPGPAGRRSGKPASAPRVRPRRDRQAADPAPPGHGRGPRQRRHERDQRRAPPLAPGGADRRARHAPTRHHPEDERPPLARWATWLGHEPREPLPPLRLLLIWDNLAGHLSWSIVRWLLQHGVMPLYTPLSGSWLNLAESVQRIIVRRALDGHHPQSQDELITWLDDTVAGWNANPTPFVWHGKRFERRQRARQRRLGGSPAAPADTSTHCGVTH